MKINSRHMYSFIAILFMQLILTSCSTIENKHISVTDYPTTNKVEISNLYTMKLDGEQGCFKVDKGYLYVVTKSNRLYKIADSNIIDNFKVENERNPSSIDITDNYVAINNRSSIIVINLLTEEVIYEYIGSKKGYVSIAHKIYIVDDILIFNNIQNDKIYGINFVNDKKIWEISEGGSALTLLNYKDKYLYRSGNDNKSFKEFNPLDGSLVDKYEYDFYGGLSYKDITIYLPKFKKIIMDKGFKLWMLNYVYGPFNITNSGIVFIIYDEYLAVYDNEIRSFNELRFEDEIEITLPYKDSFLILLFKDRVAIMDMQNNEIVWNTEYNFIRRPRALIKDDNLILFNGEGQLGIYDLSKLN